MTQSSPCLAPLLGGGQVKGLVKKPKIRDVSSWPREQDEQGPEEEKWRVWKRLGVDGSGETVSQRGLGSRFRSGSYLESKRKIFIDFKKGNVTGFSCRPITAAAGRGGAGSRGLQGDQRRICCEVRRWTLRLVVGRRPHATGRRGFIRHLSVFRPCICPSP